MSNMKCPFCNSKLSDVSLDYDWKCEKCSLAADLEVWQELIRTRKALDVAVDALDRMAIDDNVSGMIARNAIKEIKALEQKE